MNTKNIGRLSVLSSLVAIVVAMGGCGGGGGGGGGAPSPSAAPATVGVLITDAPSGRWDEAIATITSVTLIGDDGQVTLFSGSETLDLLKLDDFDELFAVSEDVPADTYNKIRLRLSDLVLNDRDDTGAIVESVHPQLVGNGKIDLNPRQPFVVAPSDIVFVEIDFDMNKALKVTETGGGKLIVRPVVFVNIQTERAEARLARVHGVINEIDPDTGEFELCQTDFSSSSDDDADPPDFSDDHCMIVVADDETGVFDEEGEPQDLSGLEVDEEVTVIGQLHALEDDDDFDLMFEAFIIEEGVLGTFDRIRGTVVSDVDEDTGRFELDVDPGQDIDTDVPLPVQLFAESRLFDRDGEELEPEDVVPSQLAHVDGVLVAGDDEHLNAPLVILSEQSPDDATLQGTVVSVDAGASSLIVNDGTMDRCVEAAGAEIFLVDDSDGVSIEHGAFGDLAAGQSVAVFGEEDGGGCIVAATILVDL